MVMTITRNPNLAKPQSIKNIQHELKNEFTDLKWWTGLAPENCPGFDRERNCLMALPLLNLNICSRKDVLDYFNNSWTLTELLFRGLKTESTYTRSPYHQLRHPLIFYYGHPAVLYLNKMRLAGLRKDPLNLYLEKVLETGVDEMSWDDMSKNEMNWPSVSEVRDYRKLVYDFVINFIQTCPELDLAPNKRNFLQGSPLWSLWMGMEHEKIHFETSSVLIRELPIELVETPKFWPSHHPSATEKVWNIKPIAGVDFKSFSWKKQTGKKVNVGKSPETESFGWDNEYGTRAVDVKDFEYSNFQISNGEFFEFVASGAYVVDKYWAPEGLHWRKFRNTKRPTFWCASGPEGSHEYELRTIFDIIPMPWSWPCEVNYHEAIAFAHWKNETDKLNNKTKFHYRLLTEAEFNALKKEVKDPVLQKENFKNFESTLEIAPFSENFNFVWGSPRSVDEELCGNVWHWLMDQFNPLDGFKTHNLYDDFSTPCFDGKHQMILGGSFISCGHEASYFARFHFRPHFYQHSGFRLSRTLDGSMDNGATYLENSKEYVHPKRLNVLDQINASSDWWKNIDQPLEFSEEEVKSMFNLTTSSLIQYHRDFKQMSPMGEAHDPKTNGLKAGFKIPYQSTKNLPELPQNFGPLLDLIFKELAPFSQLPGHSKFAAYVAGSGNIISSIAELISRELNPFSGHYMMAPGLVELENEVIKWFLNLFDYDLQKSGGFITTGSSYATLSAIMMARKKLIAGHDLTHVTGYVTEDGHHCIAKAWVMLGFKKENLKLIPMKDYKMDTSILEKVISSDKSMGLNPLFIVATLGTTKMGKVDNLAAISEISKKFKMWLHLDGAYGALFKLTSTGEKLFKDIHLSDSIAFDPHKALQLPYGTGVLLVKDAKDMIFNYQADDSYMPPTTDGIYDFADITPELSREFRGLRLWLPLKVLGIGPFKINLEEKLKLTEYLNSELGKNKKLKIHSNPELSILTFSHIEGDIKTKQLLSDLNNSKEIFLSGCQVDGKNAIRVCLLGFRIHFKEVENLLNLIGKLC